VERLKEEGWEPKLRLKSDQEHVIENMETVLSWQKIARVRRFRRAKESSIFRM
jgi:hypothetical protein